MFLKTYYMVLKRDFSEQIKLLELYNFFVLLILIQ